MGCLGAMGRPGCRDLRSNLHILPVLVSRAPSPPSIPKLTAAGASPRVGGERGATHHTAAQPGRQAEHHPATHRHSTTASNPTTRTTSKTTSLLRPRTVLVRTITAGRMMLSCSSLLRRMVRTRGTTRMRHHQDRHRRRTMASSDDRWTRG